MAVITEERLSTEERVSRIEGGQAHLATKADVAQSEARTAERIAESDARNAAQFAEIRKELAEHSAEQSQREARQIRWMLAIVGLGVAIITVLDRLQG